MRIWYNNILDKRRYLVDVAGGRVRIGRDSGNEIVLDSPFVAAEAAVITERGGACEVLALGINGCSVDGEEVRAGQRRALTRGQTVKIFPFTLTVDLPEPSVADDALGREAMELEISELIGRVHIDLLKRMDLDTAGVNPRPPGEEEMLALEHNLEKIAGMQGLADPARLPVADHVAGLCVRGVLLDARIERPGEGDAIWHDDGGWRRLVSVVPEREDELAATARHVANALGLAAAGDLTAQADRIERGFWAAWDHTSRLLHPEFKQYLALRYLKKEVKDLLFGYGPLEDLLRSPLVTEIMVVDREKIYVEKGGVVESSGRRFLSDGVTQSIIERIVSRVGRRIDRSRPLVDARLADGSRVNAVIPPLAVSGPCLTVRKFPRGKATVENLIAWGTLTRTAAEFLRAAVLDRRNIVVSGGTGTGKTTLLNCLSDFIPDVERIVTVEDTAELRLGKEHVVRLEAKEANAEGAGAYTIRDLVRNALRMRPDRIVVGECRGPEALDMLQAMNTGHDGSMTTVHANTAADVILRLEVLVQMAADLPLTSIHRQIASAVDLVVQLTRLKDGSRRVSQIAEVIGPEGHGGGFRIKDVFLLEDGENGAVLAPTGCLPTFMGALIASGAIRLDHFYRLGRGGAA